MPNKDRIARIKPKPAMVQLLERQLLASDPEVRRIGYDSIHKINAPAEPLTDCIGACFDHQNWYVRRCASVAVSKAIQSQGAADVCVKHVAGPRLASDDAEVRRCAGEGLVRIVQEASSPEAPKSIPPNTAENAAEETASKLTHQNPRVRQEAVEALGRMGSYAGPHVAAAMARVADSDLSVRNAVVRMCASLGPVATTAVDVAAANLRNEDKGARRAAAKAILALGEHSGDAAAAAVVAQLPRCKDAPERRYVLLVLIDLKELAAPHGAVISALLEDPDAGVRATAISALASAGPKVGPTCLKHLKRRVEHPDSDVRRAAIDAMCALGPMVPSFAQSMGKLLHEEQGTVTPETIRYKAAILTILGASQANAEPYLDELATHLADDDWGVRRASIEAFATLGEHGAPGAAEVARRLLHFEPDTRRAAAECLGRMGVHAGVYAGRVEALLDTEEDEDVRLACEKACELLARAGALGA